ncbi:site-specific integrase [Myxococcota bacterium]|nr:site-specific integrase [Myxococcota bacterium]MBU1498550.1 site-specific integrase [Myxococcota bacterium]
MEAKALKGTNGIRVRESKKKKWNGRPDKGYYVRIFEGGKEKEVCVGWASEGMNQLKAQKIRAEFISGKTETNPEVQVIEAVDLTLNEFAQEYLELTSKSKKDLGENDKCRYDKHIKRILGKKKLADITTFEIEKLKVSILKTHSPQTCRHVLTLLKTIYNKAVLWKKVLTNPCIGIKMPVPDNERERFLTKEEATLLLNELKPYQTLYDITLLSLGTGLRFGEIAKLQWVDLNSEAGTIHIKSPKGGKSRHVYVHTEILSMLEQRKNHSEGVLIFPNKAGLMMKEVNNTWTRIANRLFNEGITDTRDKVVFHTLRHTFASWLAIQGTPLFTIQTLMGHKTIQMTQRYARLSPDIKQKASAEVQAVLGDILSHQS